MLEAASAFLAFTFLFLFSGLVVVRDRLSGLPDFGPTLISILINCKKKPAKRAEFKF